MPRTPCQIEATHIIIAATALRCNQAKLNRALHFTDWIRDPPVKGV